MQDWERRDGNKKYVPFTVNTCSCVCVSVYYFVFYVYYFYVQELLLISWGNRNGIYAKLPHQNNHSKPIHNAAKMIVLTSSWGKGLAAGD